MADQTDDTKGGTIAAFSSARCSCSRTTQCPWNREETPRGDDFSSLSAVDVTVTFSYQQMIRHLEESDPLSYLDLPVEWQADFGIATAAINGLGRCRDSFGKWVRGDRMRSQGFDEEWINDHTCPLWCLQMILKIFRLQPNAWVQQIHRFKKAVSFITRVCNFDRNFISALRETRIDQQQVYHELMLAFIDSYWWYQRYFDPTFYFEIPESLQRHDKCIYKFLWMRPTPVALQAIPQDVLCEKHCIALIVCVFFNVNISNAGMEDTPPLGLHDIPERFPRSRLFFEHLLERNTVFVRDEDGYLGFPETTLNRVFSVPEQLLSDPTFWLNCFQGIYNYERETRVWLRRFWNAVPEFLRCQPGFLAEAVVCNVRLLWVFWECNRSTDTPFDVLVAAIKYHGSDKLVDLHLHDQSDRICALREPDEELHLWEVDVDMDAVLEAFDKELSDRLAFNAFVSCIESSRSRTSSGSQASAPPSPLGSLHCVNEHIASFLGVPTLQEILSDLQAAAHERSEYKKTVAWLSPYIPPVPPVQRLQFADHYY